MRYRTRNKLTIPTLRQMTTLRPPLVSITIFHAAFGLTDLATCVEGVQEGRQIFINLKRSIQYTISHTTPEVIPQLLYVVVPIPLPLSAILILVIGELWVSSHLYPGVDLVSYGT